MTDPYMRAREIYDESIGGDYGLVFQAVIYKLINKIPFVSIIKEPLIGRWTAHLPTCPINESYTILQWSTLGSNTTCK